MRISDWSSDVCSSDLATLDAGIGISYELNVVGRIRRTIEAAQADADAQSAAYDLARITVAANVVGAYSDACAAGARIAVATRSVDLQRQSLALTERGLRAGLYTPLDATQIGSASCRERVGQYV